MEDNIGDKFNNFYTNDSETFKIHKPIPDKTWLIIGKGTERDIRIGTTATFNWFQKKMWKFLLNIDIKDIKENKDEEK